MIESDPSGQGLCRHDRFRSIRVIAKPPSIEDHFAHIEEAVAALEGGELPLEDALARYETGLKAVRQAKALLDRYAARLEELRAEPEPPAE
jgi:exodeoxyribonuclease VII small subunit